MPKNIRNKNNKILFRAIRLFTFLLLSFFPSAVVWVDRVNRNPAAASAFTPIAETIPFYSSLNLVPAYFFIWPLVFLLLLFFVFTTHKNTIKVGVGLPDFSPAASPSPKKQWFVAVALAGALIFAACTLLTQRVFEITWLGVVGAITAAFFWAEKSSPQISSSFSPRWVTIFLTTSFYAALLGLIQSSTFSRTPESVIYGGAALAIFYALYRRKSITPLFLVVTLALMLFSYGVNEWRFSVIGDEYSFYEEAKRIAEKATFQEINLRFWDGVNVFGSHPYISSLIQAAFMRIFGANNFGWRISNPVICAASIPFFYWFFNVFTTRKTALSSAFLIAASQYIMAFGKIGYNNLQALFALAILLAAASWAIKSCKSSAFWVMGLAAGFCLYIYPAAFYAIPVAIFLLLLFRAPTSGQNTLNWGVFFLGFLLLLIPLILQQEYWKAKGPGTFLNNPDIIKDWSSLIFHLTSNFAYSIFSFGFSAQEGHFITVSHLDFISAGLALLGFALAVRLAIRQKFMLFMVVAYICMAFMVGATHDRAVPANTRMFLLLPFTIFFAACGAKWIYTELAKMRFSPRLLKIGVALGALCILALNVYQAYVISRARSMNYQSLEPLWLRTEQRIYADKNHTYPKVIWVYDPANFNAPSLKHMLEIYAVIPEGAVIEGLQEKTFPFSAQTDSMFNDPTAFIFISPVYPKEIVRALETQLTALGRTPCDIKAENGDWRFTFWLSQNMADRCLAYSKN